MALKFAKHGLAICSRLVAACCLATAIPVTLAAAQTNAAGGYGPGAFEQAEPSNADIHFYTDEELETLVGPVALYPDDLVALVLPASTYPLQIVEAARFLERVKHDGSEDPPAYWDDSVFALLNYPDVVTLLNDNPTATWQLGEAVLNQRPQVLAAIERFRERAYDAGNLHSDRHQVVEVIDEYIEISPADPEVIYVPYYEPARVVVYQTVPVYRYYPRPYPVYYYPYPAGHRFRSGFFWGISSWFSIGWGTPHLHVHGYGHSAHPYYGHQYYSPYYRTRSYDHAHNRTRDLNLQASGRDAAHNGNHRWVAGPSHGARPSQHTTKPAPVTTRREAGPTNFASVRQPMPDGRRDIDSRHRENPGSTRQPDPRVRSGFVARPSDDLKPRHEPEPAARERNPRATPRPVERAPERRREQTPVRVDPSAREPAPARPARAVVRPADSSRPSPGEGSRRPPEPSGDRADKPPRGRQDARDDNARRPPERSPESGDKPSRARQESRSDGRRDGRERL